MMNKCYNCNSNAEPGKIRCTYHLAKANERRFIREERNENLGKCRKCGGNREDLDYKMCAKCREYFRQKGIINRANYSKRTVRISNVI